MMASHTCCQEELPGSGYRSMAFANSVCPLAMSHGVTFIPVAGVKARSDDSPRILISRHQLELPQSPPLATFILKI